MREVLGKSSTAEEADGGALGETQPLKKEALGPRDLASVDHAQAVAPQVRVEVGHGPIPLPVKS